MLKEKQAKGLWKNNSMVMVVVMEKAKVTFIGDDNSMSKETKNGMFIIIIARDMPCKNWLLA